MSKHKYTPIEQMLVDVFSNALEAEREKVKKLEILLKLNEPYLKYTMKWVKKN